MLEIFGAAILSIMTFGFTVAFFYEGFNNIGLKKYATRSSILSLLIPIIMSFIYYVVPLFYYKNTLLYRCEIKTALILIFILFLVLTIIYRVKVKKDKMDNLFFWIYLVIGLVMISLFTLALNTNREFDIIVKESLIPMFKLNNFTILLLAIVITTATVKSINKSKEEFNVDKLVRFSALIITSFSLIYYLLMLNDYCQLYIKSIIADIDFTNSFISSVSNFNLIEISKLLIDSIYFSLTTFTTIGYGDISPISTFSRIVVIFEIVSMMYLLYIGLNFAFSEKGKTAQSNIPLMKSHFD